MGYIVECEGRTVWEPGRLTAELFLGEVGSLVDLFDVPSGLTVPLGDEIQVDAAALRYFLDQAFESLSRTGGKVLMLAAAPLRLCLELYEASVGEPYVAQDPASQVVERVRRYGTGL